MTEKNINSKIITFYSFKGGVGRTMALANVAFLAARSNQRVLIMDWDLEAPGLAYYFRGLSNGSWMRRLRAAPGVLNVLWEWVNRAGKVSAENEANTLFQEFLEGKSFEKCVQPIVDSEFVGAKGCLHYIGAGSPSIATPNPTPYEEALANFSWKAFFEDTSGGVVIQGLRDWAKKNYDLILIDSRTGLADVSGICTMQIPDTVALCFILNRQNIDGVARVSAAIKKKRGDVVRVRAVPMRTARQETSEEADARARAISELTKVGCFEPEDIAMDMRILAINASENVPFYETLSLFTAAESTYDPLTLQYLRLGGDLIGSPLSNVPLTADQFDLVRMRLQPTLATVDYINKLKSADPSRAFGEISRLLTSALDHHLDDGLTDESYIEALVYASFNISEADEHSEVLSLHSKAVNLVRELAESDSIGWQRLLIESLDQYLIHDGIWLDEAEQLVILDELEKHLSQIANGRALIRRISYKLKTAWIQYRQGNLPEAISAIKLISTLFESKNSQSATEEENSSIQELLPELKLLEGEISVRQGDRDSGVRSYKEGLELIKKNNASSFSSSENKSAEINLIVRLATTKATNTTPVDRALYAIQAIGNQAGNGYIVFFHIQNIIEAVLDSKRNDLAETFFRKFFSEMDRRMIASLASIYASSAKGTSSLLIKLAELVAAVAANRAGISSMVGDLGLACSQASACANLMITQLARRKRDSERGGPNVAVAAARLQASLALLNFSWSIPAHAIDGGVGGVDHEGH